MTIAGYAIGAREGILYLRAEYAYLRRFLEDVLAQRRAEGLLGKSIAARHSFDFDIRIQMGAGAYVCGEESALLNSCEGLRGDPRNRPPFPAQKGYLGFPTIVNNVETLACVARILDAGPATFSEYGSKQSAGSKLLSISGDVGMAGVYEVPFGVTLREVLTLADSRETQAVQIGGPSGRMIGPAELRPDDLLRRPGDGRRDGRLRPGPQPDRDRTAVHGVLRGRELRLLHALPGRQRPAPQGPRQGPRGPRRALRPRPVRGDRPDDEGHEPLWPGADLLQPRPDDAHELPPPLRLPREGGPEEVPPIVRSARPPPRRRPESAPEEPDERRSAIHPRRPGDPARARPDRHRSGGRRRDLHPQAVSQAGARAVRQLPRLHRQGERPLRRGLHLPGQPRDDRGERHRRGERPQEAPRRDALRRGQPLLHVVREERELRAAGPGLPVRDRGSPARVPVPGPGRRRLAPGHPDRPQPLHPLLSLRPRLPGPRPARRSSGSSAGVRTRGSRSAPGRGFATRTPT